MNHKERLDPSRLQTYSSFGDFHSDARKLVDAGRAGCPICSLICRALLFFAQDKPKLNLPNLEGEISIHLAKAITPLLVDCWGDGELLQLQLFTQSGLRDPWSQFKPFPPVAKMSSEDKCFQQIQEWITECEASHPDCQAADMVQLPTRIIDVNHTSDGFRPFLLETKGATGRYAALSYVWGKVLPLKLTKAKLEHFKSGIPWHSIPKTLQDAIIITHRLGLRYVWIDALTIIQDDHEDWEVEAALMATVYGNAYITIAATASEDCHKGIFAPRTVSARNVLVGPLTKDEHPKEVDLLCPGKIYARKSWGDMVRWYPLQKRGWTLQEQVLSRRVIQYETHNLVWHCRESRAAESGPKLVRGAFTPLNPIGFVRPPDTPDARGIKRLSEIWNGFLPSYTERLLTQESDKLPAILGVAKALQTAGMGRYHVGLWQSDLLTGLTWYSEITYPFDGPWKPTHYRPPAYRAPTWSWASLTGRVNYSWGDDNTSRLPLAQCCVISVNEVELVIRATVVEGVLEKTSACLTWDTYPGGMRP
ncbi:heterokaryon incompatibility protein-domain-containing protein [Apodospora peruviana]|uniref:Heterokaryon incompatibility protein-domain-containing protein n=1 Tax=Apodospora peruviana TaxID=516989 RepID=A0AAE0I113_9PEZI|nr:heterokaryon incompatibility protein-domain-containing protein [Apodospora peruviana]